MSTASIGATAWTELPSERRSTCHTSRSAGDAQSVNAPFRHRPSCPPFPPPAPRSRAAPYASPTSTCSTAKPDRGTFAYTFDHLAEVVAEFTDAVGLTQYALYVFDYGAPVGYTLDSALLARPGMDEIQLDLLGDYRHNVESYPDFHAYFRAHRPPLLAV